MRRRLVDFHASRQGETSLVSPQLTASRLLASGTDAIEVETHCLIPLAQHLGEIRGWGLASGLASDFILLILLGGRGWGLSILNSA